MRSSLAPNNTIHVMYAELIKILFPTPKSLHAIAYVHYLFHFNTCMMTMIVGIIFSIFSSIIGTDSLCWPIDNLLGMGKIEADLV